VRANASARFVLRSPLSTKQIPEQAKNPGISVSMWIKKVMCRKDSVDGESTTTDDVVFACGKLPVSGDRTNVSIPLAARVVSHAVFPWCSRSRPKGPTARRCGGPQSDRPAAAHAARPGMMLDIRIVAARLSHAFFSGVRTMIRSMGRS
jgi:hypothetical protein